MSQLSFLTVESSGWTLESLQHWGQFTKLAASGVLMLCIEWWSFEVGTFVMGECCMYSIRKAFIQVELSHLIRRMG